MSARLALRAPAKLNLTLAVLGRRADGYHELDSVFLAVELADRLELAPTAGDFRLRVHGPAAAGVPCDGTNLALRAARAMQGLARARGREAPAVALTLEKHVPAAAGLGGGSSDAAAAALGCCELYGLDPDAPEVLAALTELGSDCAFFLAARRTGLARCQGRGERVTPLPPLALPGALALVTPPFGCATARVYAALEPGRASSSEGGAAAQQHPWPFEGGKGVPGSLETLRSALFNDLEPAAARVEPALAAFRARLDALAPGAFRLAGSGSSCFGFFPEVAAAEAVLRRLGLDERDRRYALRGQWVLPVRSSGLARL